MARTTGATAVAERPTDALWLAALPRLTSTVDRLPVSTRPQAEAAEGAGIGSARCRHRYGGERRRPDPWFWPSMATTWSAPPTPPPSPVTGVVADVAEPFALSVADRAYVTSAANGGDSLVAVDLDFITGWCTAAPPAA